jgi:hypothetical protein
MLACKEWKASDKGALPLGVFQREETSNWKRAEGGARRLEEEGGRTWRF